MSTITSNPNMNVRRLKHAHCDRLLMAMMPFAYQNTIKFKPGINIILADTVNNLVWNKVQDYSFIQRRNININNEYSHQFNTTNVFTKTRQDDSKTTVTGSTSIKNGVSKKVTDSSQKQVFNNKLHTGVIPDQNKIAVKKLPRISPQLIGLFNMPGNFKNAAKTKNHHLMEGFLQSDNFARHMQMEIDGRTVVKYNFQSNGKHGQQRNASKKPGINMLESEKLRYNSSKTLNEINHNLTSLLVKSFPMTISNTRSVKQTGSTVDNYQTLKRYSNETSKYILGQRQISTQKLSSNTLINLSKYIDDSIENALHKVSEKQKRLNRPIEQSIIDLNKRLSPEKIISDDMVRVIMKKIRAYLHEERSRMGLIR